MIGVVGNDFTEVKNGQCFKRHHINTDDVERVAKTAKLFFGAVAMIIDLNTAHTLDTQLNVFETFSPKLSEKSKDSRFLFLANILPMLQKEVREQCEKAEFVAMDTMNFWISSMKDALIETVKVVDCIIINDAEARQLTDEPNIHKAAKAILNYGLKAVVIKRGEYGATLFTKDSYFVCPAYPLESVFDPTGAGDTFAGGFMGYLASQPQIDQATMRRAMIYGSVMASFNVEEFGTERVDRLTHDEINERFKAFKHITHFEEILFKRTVSA